MRIRAFSCLLTFAVGVAGTGSALSRVFGAEVHQAWSVVADPRGTAERLLPSLVTLLSAAGLLLALSWLTCSVVLCTAEGLRASARGARTGEPVPSLLRPRLVRLLVGAALGTTVSGLVPVAQAQPAGAQSPVAPVRSSRLDGLRLPDRTVGGLRVRPPAMARPAAGWHRVRPGESLWLIAAGRLPSSAAGSVVDAAWRRLYAANRSVVGPDPDLLLPGTVLHLPDTLRPDDPGES